MPRPTSATGRAAPSNSTGTNLAAPAAPLAHPSGQNICSDRQRERRCGGGVSRPTGAAGWSARPAVSWVSPRVTTGTLATGGTTAGRLCPRRPASGAVASAAMPIAVLVSPLAGTSRGQVGGLPPLAVWAYPGSGQGPVDLAGFEPDLRAIQDRLPVSPRDGREGKSPLAHPRTTPCAALAGGRWVVDCPHSADRIKPRDADKFEAARQSVSCSDGSTGWT
jgi:hypothetical protein